MNQALAGSGTVESAEVAMRRSLAQGDAVVSAIAPVLRHLLASDENAFFADDVLARVRGVTSDIARQLMDRLAAAGPDGEATDRDGELLDALADALFGQPAFLGHVHALALEWQLTERMQAKLSLDPVLSPLLQALVASPDSTTAALAMKLLAAQARFVQAQRRMQLPLGELPGDLLHGALLAMHAAAGRTAGGDERSAAAAAAIRSEYDESRSRLGLIARLVTGMGGGARAALSLGHAGVAIFLSALAIGSGQDRDIAAISTGESQLARLALALLAAGAKPAAVAEELLTVHADFALPDGFEQIGAERAAAMLALGPSAT